MKVRSDSKYQQLAEEVGELLFERTQAEKDIPSLFSAAFTSAALDPGTRSDRIRKLGDAELRRMYADHRLSFVLGRAIENPRDYDPFVPAADGSLKDEADE
jgi:hypothetical protein